MLYGSEKGYIEYENDGPNVGIFSLSLENLELKCDVVHFFSLKLE